MAAQFITSGPWQVPVKVIGALCEDGRRRTAYITAEADTYFSIPARVSVKGKTVTGFVSGCENEQGEQDYTFTANLYGKNHALLDGGN